MARSRSFTFDGGAATYLGTVLLAVLVTLCTLGIAYPYGLVLKQRWIAKHTDFDPSYTPSFRAGTFPT